MEENTTDAVVNAPEATFGIPTVRDTGDWTPEQIPTREEIERIEAAAAEDDDFDNNTSDWHTRDDKPGPTGPSIEHMAPDNDPYGWIAGVEAGHPDHIRTDHVRPVEVPHVLIWQHAMIEPHRFDHAVAKVLPNGTLLVTPRASDVPLKGYAPGVWVTFEHIGDEYHVRPQRLLPVGRVRTTNYLAQERAAVSMARSNAMLAEHADEMTQVLTDPARRTPPTHESDADDTQNIPAVKPDETKAGGGGVSRPFGRGARPDAGYDGHLSRPSIADAGPDETTPGRFRSLWRSLINPDWAED